MASQRKMKSRIEKEYTLSLLGGGIFTSSNVKVNSRCTRKMSLDLDKLMNEALKDFSQSLRLRQTQPITDMVLRETQQKVCVPHLTSSFPRTTGKLDHRQLKRLRKTKLAAPEKARLSLSQAMIYTIVRCRLDHTKFTGALLPLTVSTSSSDDHANMIYLNFLGDRITCYLFEPNGVTFARTYPDGIKRVRSAWRDVVQTLPHIDPEVTLAGGSGIQTELGLKSRYAKQGFAICGAITFWVFIEWIDSQVLSFSDFEEALITKLQTSEQARREVQLRVLHFIKQVRKNVEKSYSKRLQRALTRDSKVIQKNLKDKFSHPGCHVNLRQIQTITTCNPLVKLNYFATIKIEKF